MRLRNLVRRRKYAKHPNSEKLIKALLDAESFLLSKFTDTVKSGFPTAPSRSYKLTEKYKGGNFYE